VSLAALLSLDHRLMAEDTLVALDRMEGTVNDVRASPASGHALGDLGLKLSSGVASLCAPYTFWVTLVAFEKPNSQYI
jgi:hypothetical protein